MDLNKIKKIHFIGIGGIGVSALAKIMKFKGLEVTGSDLKSSEITKSLENIGIKVFYTQTKNNIDKYVDLVVKTSAVKENEETLKAKELNIPVLKRGEFLALISNNYKLVAVAGSHGKTTTSALIVYVLKNLGENISFNVGGILSNYNTNSNLEEEGIFVTESDESDGSFLMLEPYIAVLNNLDPEHLDHYGSFENLKKAFKKFSDKSNMVVWNLDDKNFRSMNLEGITFGFDERADYRALNIKENDIYSFFDLYVKNKFVRKIKVPLKGIYNIYNVLGVIAVFDMLGFDLKYIDFTGFKGVKRRSELVYKNDKKNIYFYDDYAHHPVEIEALFKNILRKNNVVVLYQPHRYTRTRDNFKEITEVLKLPERLIILKEYAASEEVIKGAGAMDIFKVLDKSNYKFLAFADNKSEAQRIITENFKENYILYSVGAGNLNEVLYSLRESLDD